MKLNKSKTRRIIALIFTAIYLILAVISGQWAIYIEVINSMSIPLTIILGGYFGRHIVGELKKDKKIDKTNTDLS